MVTDENWNSPNLSQEGGNIHSLLTSLAAKRQRAPPLAGKVTSQWCSLDIAECSKSHLGEDEFSPKVFVGLWRYQQYQVRKTHLAKNGNAETLCNQSHTETCSSLPSTILVFCKWGVLELWVITSAHHQPECVGAIGGEEEITCLEASDDGSSGRPRRRRVHAEERSWAVRSWARGTQRPCPAHRADNWGSRLMENLGMQSKLENTCVYWES